MACAGARYDCASALCGRSLCRIKAFFCSVTGMTSAAAALKFASDYSTVLARTLCAHRVRRSGVRTRGCVTKKKQQPCRQFSMQTLSGVCQSPNMPTANCQNARACPAPNPNVKVDMKVKLPNRHVHRPTTQRQAALQCLERFKHLDRTAIENGGAQERLQRALEQS